MREDREEREKKIKSYNNRVNIHGYYHNFENAQYYRGIDIGRF